MVSRNFEGHEMKFSAKQDVDAPAAFVFAAFSDFDAWERAGLRRGAEITRTDSLSGVTSGMTWQVKFMFRSKMRTVDIRLDQIIAPQRMEFLAQSPAMEASMVVEIAEMSALRSRIHIVSDVSPRTLTAKLFIQSLRLARAKADRKYALRVSEIATDISARYRDENLSA
jgi:hypothetical protein